ncbi:cytochrome c oxidase subunit 3 family protein [Caenispirillum salinarum]|uniref:cytochrome c oxidase subunit 3 family protein n=1 Tax=Caenispirillum salinarum TaxID=859058 RepID=UPI00384D8D59
MTRLEDMPDEDQAPADWGPLSDLPGNPFMWILILSELAVFGAFLMGFAGARLANPDLFAESQAQLSRVYGGLNTLVLVTSGWFAALAVRNRAEGAVRRARMWLGAAAVLGAVFLAVKVLEYGEKISAGVGLETNTFWTLYWLITGFHALHVVAGIGILALVAWKSSLENLETGTAFWHMVDLIWVLIYPVLYLIR